MNRASVAYIERNGLLLSVTRRDTGQHAVPGGKLKPKESPEDALSREIREETKLVITKAWRIFDGVYNGCLVRVYRAEADGDPVAMEPYTRVEWVEPARIANGFASEMHAEALVAANILTRGRIPPPTLREQLLTIVAKKMANSTEPVPHYHLCYTSGPSEGDYVQECFCQNCAQVEAKKMSQRGESAKVLRGSENNGPDEFVKHCSVCEALVTFDLNRHAALDELNSWEGRPGKRMLVPNDWRLFMLCIKSLDDEHLLRARNIIERNTIQP
jgi:ADP-ribose pyrophosphatase YjhB (NUDIX family)